MRNAYINAPPPPKTVFAEKKGAVHWIHVVSRLRFQVERGRLGVLEDGGLNEVAYVGEIKASGGLPERGGVIKKRGGGEWPFLPGNRLAHKFEKFFRKGLCGGGP